MQAPVPPIVAIEGRDIMLYASVDSACLDLEAVDVRDDVYEAFDSHGKPLILATEGDVVTISADPERLPEPDKLASALRRYVESVGAERIGIGDPERAPLSELVSTLTRFQAR